MLNIPENINLSYDEFLKEIKKAEKFHGHICGGIFNGVKVSLIAKRIMNYEKFPSKDLIVVTEIDRCLTDAVMSVTGCRFGRKTLKFKDYGKFGATFYSLSEDDAIRIVSHPEAMDRMKKEVKRCGIDEHDKEKMGEMFFNFPIERQFIIKKASVHFTKHELPGKPEIIVQCSICRENIMDGKHIIKGGGTYCRHCLEHSC